jgi:hypothetical protein
MQSWERLKKSVLEELEDFVLFPHPPISIWPIPKLFSRVFMREREGENYFYESHSTIYRTDRWASLLLLPSPTPVNVRLQTEDHVSDFPSPSCSFKKHIVWRNCLYSTVAGRGTALSNQCGVSSSLFMTGGRDSTGCLYLTHSRVGSRSRNT